jgi:hypothetical protein
MDFDSGLGILTVGSSSPEMWWLVVSGDWRSWSPDPFGMRS